MATVEILYVIIGTALTVLLAVLGFEVSAQTPTTKKKIWAYRGAFILLGIGMVMVNVMQNTRVSRTQLESERQMHQDQMENRRALDDMQARLEVVDRLVRDYAKGSPHDEKARHLTETVKRLAAPNPPIHVTAVVQ